MKSGKVVKRVKYCAFPESDNSMKYDCVSYAQLEQSCFHGKLRI